MLPLKLVYMALGFVFVGTGVVGVFLPVLPTTPFMILALWMFSKSSDRFHHWLYSHPVFGPPLQLWREYRVVPLAAKVVAVSMMIASFIYVVFWTAMPLWAISLIALVMVSTAWFILDKPSRIPE